MPRPPRVPQLGRPFAGPRRKLIIAVAASGGETACFGVLVQEASSGQILCQASRALPGASELVAEVSGVVAGLELARAVDASAELDLWTGSGLSVHELAGHSLAQPQLVPLLRKLQESAPAQVCWRQVGAAEVPADRNRQQPTSSSKIESD